MTRVKELSFISLWRQNFHPPLFDHSISLLIISLRATVCNTTRTCFITMTPYNPSSDNEEEAEPEAAPGLESDMQPASVVADGDNMNEGEVTDDMGKEAGTSHEPPSDVEAPPDDEKPSTKKPSEKKEKPEMNPDFKELKETGQWGKISTTERNIVIVVIMLILAGVIAAVVIVLSGGDGSSDNGSPDLQETDAPTAAPMLSVEDRYELVVDAMSKRPVLSDAVGTLASDPQSYKGVIANDSAPALVRAMSWILFDDDSNDPVQMVSRFALAAIYFDLDGDSWPKRDGWVSESSVCEWDGIDCDRFGYATQVDLSNMGLTGQVPPYFSLLSTVQAVWLKDNQLSGELDGDIFGSMPSLTILYLENNQLSGTIPPSLIDNGALRK